MVASADGGGAFATGLGAAVGRVRPEVAVRRVLPAGRVLVRDVLCALPDDDVVRADFFGFGTIRIFPHLPQRNRLPGCIVLTSKRALQSGQAMSRPMTS